MIDDVPDWPPLIVAWPPNPGWTYGQWGTPLDGDAERGRRYVAEAEAAAMRAQIERLRAGLRLMAAHEDGDVVGECLECAEWFGAVLLCDCPYSRWELVTHQRLAQALLGGKALPGAAAADEPTPPQRTDEAEERDGDGSGT